jgi:hypothetical protein
MAQGRKPIDKINETIARAGEPGRKSPSTWCCIDVVYLAHEQVGGFPLVDGSSLTQALDTLQRKKHDQGTLTPAAHGERKEE